MKPLKYACLILTALTVVVTAGCSSEVKTTSKAPFFGLKETPQVAVLKEDTVYNRVSDEFQDTLVASDFYGELIPFVGSYTVYKSTTEGSTATLKKPMFGLCKLNGEVVVDAVYDNIIKHEIDEGGYVYELIKGTDGSVPTAGERWVAKSDGSWVFQLPSNRIVKSVGGERVVLERTYKSGKNIYKFHEFYTFEGKRKFTFSTSLAKDKNTTYTIGKFSDGLAPVNVTVKTPDKVEKGQKQTYTETNYAYYIDNNGKKIYENYSYCGEFYEGLAIVVNEDGLYGVMNTKAEQFIEPKYRDIDYNREKGLFALGGDGEYEVIDMEKKSVKTIRCDRGYIDIINSDELIYKKTNIDTGRVEYFYFDTGKPFSCKETGMFPDSDTPIDGLYTCTYSGTGTIFNEDGESIEAIGDFGALVDRFGNTAVVVNSSDKKMCFVSVSAKQRTEWMNYHYLRQALDERYLVVRNSESQKYGLYDIMTNAFVYDDCDYIEVISNGDTQHLSVISGGKATVYDKEFNVLLSVSYTAQY